MTKNRFIAIAAFLAVHSAVIAASSFRTEVSSFSQQGFGALSTHIVSFLGLSFLVLTIKQKIWRTGGILASLSALLRSYRTSVPDQKVIFGVMTLIVSFGALVALAASWKKEEFDLNWWQRDGQKTPLKTTCILLIALAIVGTFLYWGRG